MAKLYYCNSGDIEFQTETLNALKGLPPEWRVLLNCRPAGVGQDREIDALVITQRAIHVVEFKHRVHAVHITSEGHWLTGGRRDLNSRGESPSEQVIKTKDAFMLYLRRNHPELKVLTFAWVVLERYNKDSRLEQKPLRANRYRNLGNAYIANGVQYLQDVLAYREEQETGITANVATRLIEALGAKPLDMMLVEGKVISLESGKPLPSITLRLDWQEPVAAQLSHQPESQSDTEGYFSFGEVPIARFRIEALVGENLYILPNEAYTANAGLKIVPVYVVRKGMDEAQVHKLLSEDLSRFEHEVRQLRSQLGQELHKVNQQLHEAKQRLESEQSVMEMLVNDSAQYESAIHTLKEAVNRLQADQQRALLYQGASVESLLQEASLPIKQELSRLRQQISRAEEVAREAQASAAKAAREASVSREAQQEQARIQQERWETEQLTSQEAKRLVQLRAEALKWSAILGGAGGIISMQPLPFADNMILAPMQIGLVMYIGKLYGRDFTADLALKLVGTLGLGFVAQHATVALYKLIPGAWLLGAITVPAFTILLGYVATLYFELGTTISQREQLRLLGQIRVVLKDKELSKNMKSVGSIVADEIKSRGYRLKAEDMREIMGKVGDHGRDIGERLVKLLQNKD